MSTGVVDLVEPFRTILNDRTVPPRLSPAWELGRPDVITLRDARAYGRMFSGLLAKRSPATVARKGLFRSFLLRSSLLKLEHDLVHGYDISVTPYPVALDLKAWGLVVHPAGRVMEVSPRDDGLLDLTYHGGYCRSRQDWRRLAELVCADEQDEIRRFYNRVRGLARDRIILAGTVGFGLWDALWMAFEFERACELLTEDKDFVGTVLNRWMAYHLGAASAMLDAGVKLIVIRENPGGFPPSLGMAARLDSVLGDHYRELSQAVRNRGGCLFLDCDADEIFETDLPSQWGFDGIGPLLFRDEEDLRAARQSLTEEILLVGTIAFPTWRPSIERAKFPRGLIITNRPGPTPHVSGSEAGHSDRTSPAILMEDLRLAG
jgi:hypothetical protein